VNVFVLACAANLSFGNPTGVEFVACISEVLSQESQEEIHRVVLSLDAYLHWFLVPDFWNYFSICEFFLFDWIDWRNIC
jgi:hypothetical protein